MEKENLIIALLLLVPTIVIAFVLNMLGIVLNTTVVISAYAIILTVSIWLFERMWDAQARCIFDLDIVGDTDVERFAYVASRLFQKKRINYRTMTLPTLSEIINNHFETIYLNVAFNSDGLVGVDNSDEFRERIAKILLAETGGSKSPVYYWAFF